VERRAGERALVPASIIRNRDFAAACAAVLLMSAVFFAALLYLPQFMAKVLGFTPLESGAGLLPMMATFACVSFAAGPLYDRIGPKTTVTCGAAAITAGILALSFLDPGWSYLALVPGMVVLGIGVGLFYSSITTAGVTALDPAQASLAGAIVYMFQIAGGAIGLGVNTAIVASAGEGTAGLVAGIGDAFRLDALLAGCAVLVAAAFVGGRGRFADRLHLHRPHLHRAHG
jgi:MFS family permease